MGIDVRTLPEPTSELWRVVGRDQEVEPVLLVQNDDKEPTTWLQALGTHDWYRFQFTSVEDTPKFGDGSTVAVSGYRDGECWRHTSGNFFSICAQLDEATRDSHSDDGDLTLADRHRAAAMASAAGVVGVDVIVTAAPTALRDDIADNDSVISVTPGQLLPLFGHYLRRTGNQVLVSAKGQMQGGGTFVEKLNAVSITGLYAAGVDASVPHLTAIRLMAEYVGDAALIESMRAISLRLSRAARAVDELLAALSNGSSSAMQRADTAEATAEAFERTLLYLCAAMDRYARLTRSLLDTSLDPDEQRCSLTSTRELSSVIEKFEPTDTAELEQLGAYARIIGQLRNRIHALPLDTQHQLSRAYGSSTVVAVTLEGLAEFDPATTPLDQNQLDHVGVWNAQPSNLLEPRAYVADVATLATTLFRETLRYVEEFSRFLVRNKTRTTVTTAQHRVLGCWADDPRPMPDAFGNEILYREMLGWAEFG